METLIYFLMIQINGANVLNFRCNLVNGIWAKIDGWIGEASIGVIDQREQL